MATATFTTACPRNCYSTCTATVHVAGGRVVKLEPHVGNRATPEGVCLKGLSYVERVASPDRILHPLRRNGERFERISWEEAIDTIAERLDHVRREHGPKSVLFYAASGTKGLLNRVSHEFWRAFGGYTTTYGDLCWPAGLEATRLTLGENKHSAPWDLVNAKLIVMWGKNAAETNVHQTVFVRDAVENGATLVVVDPRRTQTAEGAHLHVRPRPGTDGALALGLAHLLIEGGAVDEAFVSQHVVGYDAFRDLARAYPPDRVAFMTDVPVASLERLAALWAASTASTICAGYGMQRYSNSGQTLRAMIGLLAITGNVGRAGAGWVFANLSSHVFDAVKDPEGFYPPERPDGIARVSISTALLGKQMLEERDPPLKAAWVERGNPVTQNPDTHRVLEAFRSLEFRVVVEQFLTDTAREADIVLPAKSMFEQSDVITAYWHGYIQLKQKVIEPPGEVKPETEIYRLLGERLRLPGEALEGIPGPSDEDVEAYLERALEPFGVTLDALRDGPVLGPDHEEVAFADLRFSTPSGKIELVSRVAAERWGVDALPSYREPLAASDRPREFPLYLMTPNTKNAIHSQFHNLQVIRQQAPPPRATLHPDDASSRGIAPGQTVRIFNDRGELRLPAHLDWGAARGTVAVNNGWWITDGGTVNYLSPPLETDMGYGAAFHETRVEVEKAERH